MQNTQESRSVGEVQSVQREPITEQTSSLKNEVNPGLIVIPILVGIIVWWLLNRYFDRWKKWIDETLSATRFGYERAYLLGTGTEVLIIGACIEAADLSAFADGSLDVGSLAAACALAVSFPMFIFTQKILFYHQQRERERFEKTELKKLENKRQAAVIRARLADEQYLLADRMRQFLTTLLESDNDKIAGRREVIEERLKDNLSSTGTRHSAISDATFLKIAAPLGIEASRVTAIAQQVFEARRPRVGGKRNRVRVALFERKADRFEVVASFDGQRTDVVRSPKSDSGRFSIDNMRGCLAVAAGFEYAAQIVEDAVKGDRETDCPFHYFGNRRQRAGIKSIVAIPVRFDGDTSECARYVLCADCTQPGYFDGDLTEEASFISDFTKHRLELASAMDDLYQCLFLSRE